MPLSLGNRTTHRFMHAKPARIRTIPWRIAAALAASAACLALSGCGNGLAQVSGQVTVDGQPLRSSEDVRVVVQFQPVSAAGTTSVGLVDENGNYVLGTGSQTGIPPGEYYVCCSGTELIRAKGSRDVQGGRAIADPKYASAKTSGLKFTVQPGKNEFSIPLTSPPKTSSRPGA
jgi:hypothetical protein